MVKIENKLMVTRVYRSKKVIEFQFPCYLFNVANKAFFPYIEKTLKIIVSSLALSQTGKFMSKLMWLF